MNIKGILVLFALILFSFSAYADVYLRVNFTDLNNWGSGDVEERIYVGTEPDYYSEGESIPLIVDGERIIDSTVEHDVPGIAIQREYDYVLVSLWGRHIATGGKEAVSGTITFENAEISDFVNGSAGPLENQGDLNYEFGNAGQDEVFSNIDTSEAEFIMTVTTDFDSFKLYYETLPEPNTAPYIERTFDNLYYDEVTSETTYDNIFDLYYYFEDDESPDSDLDYTLTQTYSSLFNCSVDDHYIDCTLYANRTGSSQITVFAEDPEGETSPDNKFTIYVNPYPENESPTINSIPNQTIYIDEDWQYHLINLYNYAYDDEDSLSELTFSMSQSDSDVIYCYIDDDHYISCDEPKEIGKNYITVTVRDSQGATDSDQFYIEVKDELDYPECDELEIVTSTVYVDEDETVYKTFRLENNSDYRFNIEDFDAYDYSSYFSVYEYSHSSYANTDSYANLTVRVKGNDVSADREGTAYVKVKGRFSNGEYCSYNDIGTESFKVKVNDTGNGEEPSCSDIGLDFYDITIDEDETSYRTFTIENNSDERFYIDEEDIIISESSSYLSVYVVESGTDDSIAVNSEGDLKLKFVATEVSTDKTVTVTVKLPGEFSGGKNCSASSVQESFTVTIDNEPEEPEDEIEIELLTSSITLNPSQSETVVVSYENNSGSWTCFDLEATTSSSKISAEVEDDHFCLNAGTDRRIDLTVSASNTASEGSYTVELESSFNATSETETLSVRVETGEEPEPEPEIRLISFTRTVDVDQNASSTISATIENTTGREIENITMSLTGLPAEIYFEPVHRDSLAANSTVTLTGTLEVRETEERSFTALLEIEAEGVRIVEEVSINVSTPEVVEPEEEEVGFAGLVGLVGSVALGLGLFVILLFIVVIIVYLVKKK